MKFAIVVFPGSNCDQDCFHIAKDLLGCEADSIWHAEKDLKGADVVILPGGFAYGDYLRAGALARFSPVMESVAAFARSGGAVRVNRGLRYVCRDVRLRVERTDTPFTRLYAEGEVVTMPIGHMEGNYTAAPEVLDELERSRRVVFRYCDASGRVIDAANPNGADRGIAGIANREGNVVGLMPHPDRCAENVLGNSAGLRMFESAVRALAAR